MAEIFRRRRGRLDLDRLAALHRVRRMWPTMVGEKLASHSFVHSLQRDAMYVIADASVWVSELEYLRCQILERVEMVAECGIQRLQCRVGTLPKSLQDAALSTAVNAISSSAAAHLLIKPSAPAPANVTQKPLTPALKDAVQRLPEALRDTLYRLLERRR